MLKSLFTRLNRLNPHRPSPNYLHLAKIILALFIVINLGLKIIPILAQDPNPTDDPPPTEELDTTAYDEFVNQIHEAKQNISAESWNANMFDTTAINICDALTGQCPTTTNIAENISQNGFYLPGGMLGTTNNLIAQTYNPPASGIQYLAHLKDNLLGKPAYAQGIGFVGLEPLLPIWRGFRNVVYLLSTVYFVILGIMVMFRLKINPQTVLTVQSAVPQVITTLLLVTFSYAIAGLLIDLTYLIQNIVLVLLFQVQGKGLGESLFNEGSGLRWSNLFKFYNFKNLSDAALGDISRLTRLAVPKNAIFLLSVILGAVIGGIFGTGTLGAAIAAGAGFGALGGAILLLVISLLIIISMFKFFFGLLKAYVNIIFKIILGPLEIGLGAIPGMKIGFSSWANNLFANLLIFPISLLFLVLANVIIEQTSGGQLWAPTMVKYNLTGTLINAAAFPSGGIVPVAVGFTAILLMSKLPEIIPQIFFAIKPSGLQQAIGQNVFSQKILPFGKSLAANQAAGVVEEGATSHVAPRLGGFIERNLNRLGIDTDTSKRAVGDAIRQAAK